MTQPKNERKVDRLPPLCPLAGFRECRQGRCALWDDDWTLCSLNYGSLYSSARAAATDAAVEIIKHYGNRFGDDGR